VPVLTVDGVALAYDQRGTGPVLVVPACNLGVGAYRLEPYLDRFTVVAVSPRGFQASGRLAPAAYSGAQVVGDIGRVLDHLGVERYAVLGYSLNGAVASYLALEDPRVRAVVCGGFPTTASFAGLTESRRQQLEERRRDPEVWAETLAALDPAALLAFWTTLDALPPGRLASGPACPVWSWWGGADPLFDPFGGVGAHRAALDRLGLPSRELPGLDHDEALLAVTQVLPEIVDWLTPLTA
jgi:pimeloyl-ACP methyl ester carboxylesterase